TETITAIYDALERLYGHLASASGNPVFQRTYAEAWFGLKRAQRGEPHLIQTPAAIAREFRRLAARIEAGDAAGAERIIRSQFRLDEGGDDAAESTPGTRRAQAPRKKAVPRSG